MTQTQELLALLRERPEGVTPLEALHDIGSLRLAARILDLKREGHPIVSEWQPVTARNGRRVRVKRYRLVVA